MFQIMLQQWLTINTPELERFFSDIVIKDIGKDKGVMLLKKKKFMYVVNLKNVKGKVYQFNEDRDWAICIEDIIEGAFEELIGLTSSK